MSLITDILLMSDTELTRYINKVSSAGGVMRSREAAKTMLKFYKNKQLLQNIRLLVAPEIGIITSDEGTDVFVPTLISADSVPNNVTPPYFTSQPYLAGDIAPNEKYALHNPNGATRFMQHSTISYAANEAWNITFVCNYNGTGLNTNLFTNNTQTTRIRLNTTPNSYDLGFRNESGTEIINIYVNNSKIGKNNILTFVGKGSSLDIYFDGIKVVDSYSINTNISLSQINDIKRVFAGKLHFYKIQNGALTASEIAEEHAMLRSIFPEVESVQIGTQQWATSNFEAVCTPQGNLINELQISSNINRITNGDFSSSIGWTLSNATISGGVLNCNAASGYNDFARRVMDNTTTTVGKWYKITYTISSYTSGKARLNVGGFTVTTLQNAIGTYTQYIQVTNTSSNNQFFISSDNSLGFIGTIDDVSCEEVGWSDSTNLYDAVYAATSGTVEQKTYAAVKAAAMWCHYNNDVATGAIYGKLYNWYAVKLLQMDFILANFGYLISSDSDNMITDADASKVIGTKYWSNANGTNSNGLSLIGAGYRDLEGNFIGLKNICILWNADDNISNDEKRYGFAVRIIKSV